MAPGSGAAETAPVESVSDHQGLITVSQAINEKIAQEAWHCNIHSSDKKIKTTQAQLLLQSLLN